MINWTKLTRENNSLITASQITLHIICINFQVLFFENNVREFETPNAVCEKIIRLHIFLLNQGRSILKTELIYKRRCGSLFCYFFGFTCLVRFVSRNMIFFSSQTQFFSKAINFNFQSIFNLNSHKHFYSVEKKNRIHLNIIYNLHFCNRNWRLLRMLSIFELLLK